MSETRILTVSATTTAAVFQSIYCGPPPTGLGGVPSCPVSPGESIPVCDHTPPTGPDKCWVGAPPPSFNEPNDSEPCSGKSKIAPRSNCCRPHKLDADEFRIVMRRKVFSRRWSPSCCLTDGADGAM